MSRRRPSFRAYVRRRWRALGLLLVLLAGSLLVLAVTDRGHDPLWEAREALVDQVVPSPEGDVVYSLSRSGGAISGLQAWRADTGALLWKSDMNASRALLRAGDGGVAVATDFPLAFLTFYGNDGPPRYQIAIEGNPRAMAVGTGILALAVQGPGNKVLLVEDGRVARTLQFDSFVSSIDLEGDRIAIGSGNGEVAVYATNGSRVFDARLPISVKSVRLSADGSTLVAAGYSLTQGDLSGGVSVLDVNEGVLRWTRPTSAGIGFVDVDRAGLLVLAVEESPPRHSLHAYDASTGEQRWVRQVDGLVARDDAGAYGAAALSPDGSVVVAATLYGPIEAYSARTGNPTWSYGSAGSTTLAFASDAPQLLAANARLTQSGASDTLLFFSTTGEPTFGQLPTVAALVAAAAVIAAAAILGVGYWRVRRSY